jgi:hypothetical protein
VVDVLTVVETLQHLGPLHRGEQVLVYLLAFGPLLLLALTVWVSRRRHRSEASGSPGDGPGSASLGFGHDADEPDRGAPRR